MIEIRKEEERDFEQVFEVNKAAFGTDAEAKLVDALRGSSGYISFVADIGGRVVGHISFSPVTLDSRTTSFAGLAPVSVLPDFQKQGVGSKLVAEGLNTCRVAGLTAVFVLGHSSYYPRFGFGRASLMGFSCEYPSPDESFMVLELEKGSLKGKGGMIRYDRAFAGF